ncbi:MAG: FHA domain-containing protein [Thermodesulfobacteriota bacterium]
MVMIRCSASQHFYDPEKHDSCPYCRGAGGLDSTRGVETVGARGGEGLGDDVLPGETTPTAGLGATASTARLNGSTATQMYRPDPAGETVGMFKKVSGFEPVVGWLVCTDGPQKGRDYRIKPGVNELGRDPQNSPSVALGGDDTAISRRWHAVIEYYDQENEFYINRKDNPEVWLNDKRVLSLTQLKPYDRIQLGSTRYMFIPLCTEDFKWVLEEKPSS